MLRPDYAEFARRGSISRLMERLQDDDIVGIEVILWDYWAYITLSDRHSASFVYCSRREWTVVEHMLTINPLQCACWACEWRMKRRRYLDLSLYKHLFQV